MTISIKSNADGLSGAIQVNGVDVVGVETTGITSTLIDPIIKLNGSEGVAGQALITQGPGLSPAWGSVNSVSIYDYDSRSVLRSIDGPSNILSVIESLGVFVWVSGSTEPDDDETCFATDTGRWLMYAASWDFVNAQMPSIPIIRHCKPVNSIVSVSGSGRLTQDVVVVGATVGSTVAISAPSALPGAVIVSASVSSPGVVTIVVSNTVTAVQSIPQGNWAVTVFEDV